MMLTWNDWRTKALVLVALLCVAGCGSVTSNNLPDGAVDAAIDRPFDGAATDGGAGSDSGATDGATPDGASASCAQRTYDDTLGVFVDGTREPADNCGDRTVPCTTITRALEVMRPPRRIVYVARGIYTESISVPAGVRIEGAWSAFGGTWTPACGADGGTAAVVIQAPSTANTTVRAVDLGGAAELALLTILSKTTAGPGESLYGVLAKGAASAPTRITLQDVEVTVADAGNGAHGTPGAGGQNASAQGCAPANDGANGAPSATLGEDAPEGGTFGPTGYAPNNGGPGADGADGHNGTAGGTGTCVPETGNCGHCTSTTSLSCATDPPSCGTAGKAGCGGRAGKAGGGGQGGGSAFALYLWDATAILNGGALVAGDGGDGGLGGQGGPYGIGAAGVAGTAATASCGNCNWGPSGGAGSGTTNVCTTLDLGRGAAGAAGGPGGNGSGGTPGGGGSGGSSFAIYRGGNSTASYNTAATPLVAGRGGVGGGRSNDGTAASVGP